MPYFLALILGLFSPPAEMKAQDRSAASEPITGDYRAEGPTAIKIGEEWFVYFDKYIEKQYGVLTSSDLQVWTDRSDQLNMPQGMRHGTVFQVSEETAEGLLAL